MSSSLAEVQDGTNDCEFDVVITESDAVRAYLRARGRLDSSNAPLLVEVIAGHLRARRRFLRLDVAELVIADSAAMAAIKQAHQLALRARGTLILIKVSDALRHSFEQADLDTELFMLPPAAHDVAEPGDLAY
jgi:anti-anti-sigma regulatory factor